MGGEAGRWDGRCKGSSMRRGKKKKEERVISQQHRAKQEEKPDPGHELLKPGRLSCSALC